MKTSRAAILVCSVLLFSAEILVGQSAPGVFADANHPGGPPDPQKLDAVWQVDPISDQVTINIPFTTTPQGGRGPKLPFALLYNSGSTVTLQGAGTYPIPGGVAVSDFLWSTKPISGSSTAPSGPWTTTGPFLYYTVADYPTLSAPYPPYTVYGYGCTIDGPYVYVDENGSAHDMNLDNLIGVSPGETPLAPACYAAYGQWQTNWPNSSTSDGSAMATSSGLAVGPDGTSVTGSFEAPTGPITPATVTLTDPNLNTAKLALNSGVYTATDALGRTVYITNIPIGITGPIPAGTYYLKTENESGTSENYNIVFSNVAIGTFTLPHPADSEMTSAPFCSGSTCITNMGVGGPSAGSKLTAVTEIDLPDNASSYKFAYDSTYGTISMITFPTGGYVRFCWGVRDKDWSPYGQASVISSIVVINAFTSSSTVPSGSCDPPAAGSNESKWTYAMESLDNSSVPVGQVTAPDLSYTQYVGTCLDFAVLTMYSQGQRASCKESSRAMYDSGGHLKESVAQSFDAAGVTRQVATTLYDGANGPLQQLVNYIRDGYENVTEKDESDYYSCTANPLCPGPTQSSNLPKPSGGWIRSTYTNYTPNSAMLAAHIVNKPSQVMVTDGGSNVYSWVNFTYNNYGNLTNESKCISPTPLSGAYPNPSCSAFWPTQYGYSPSGPVNGQVYSKTEGGVTTNYTWTGPSGSGDSSYSNGYLTKITYPNNATDQYTYFGPIGAINTHTDWNTNSTSYDYTDSLNRIKTITLPATIDGTTGTSASGTTTYSYNDSPGNFSVGVQQKMSSNGTSTQATTYFDGLGRKITATTVTPECSSSPIEVDTVYDSMSRVYSVTNPYCSTSDPTFGTTYFFYDGLGRKTKTEFADFGVNSQSFSTISYSGTDTEFTDPSNGTVTPQHIQRVNGLGQLMKVCEVSASGFGNGNPTSCGLNIPGIGFLTTYAYDPLNNLLAVNQHGVSRSFTYDSLSRLTYASNPEAGPVTYVYSTQTSRCAPDASVPCSKTDNRGVTVSYGYDTLSRVVSKSYSGSGSPTPISCYQYDSSPVPGAVVGYGATGGNLNGHLTNAWTQVSSASAGTCTSLNTFVTLKSYFAYDPVGRPEQTQQQTCVAGNCTSTTATQSYPISMSHDLIGDMTTLTNPVGANGGPLTLTNHFNSATHLCLTTSSWTSVASPNIFEENPTASATSPGYSPGGGLQNYFLGSSSSSVSSGCSSSPTSPINAVLNYTKRFWVSGISVTGQIP